VGRSQAQEEKKVLFTLAVRWVIKIAKARCLGYYGRKWSLSSDCALQLGPFYNYNILGPVFNDFLLRIASVFIVEYLLTARNSNR